MAGVVRFRVRFGGPGGETTRVRVGPRAARALAMDLQREPFARRLALLTDSAVMALAGEEFLRELRAAGLPVLPVVWSPGEICKTRETKTAIEDEMLRAGLGRDTAVVAVGGGVVTDVAGFVAATYARGIPWTAVPTTMIGMADAAIGGKTAVNTPFGKNLIGAFHPPRAVYADPALLATLPDRALADGLAEVVKAAAMCDARAFARLERDAPALLGRKQVPLQGAILAAMRAKARIVERDPREAGLRRVLNFGHTIGHAYEAAARQAPTHGEGVAIGMVAESRYGEAVGVTAPGTADRIERLLVRLGLPVGLPQGIEPARLLPFLALDKKARGGRPALALPRRIGLPERASGRWVVPVEGENLLRVLEKLRSDTL